MGRKSMLSLITYGHSVVLAQEAVAEKINEIPIAQRMLGQWDLND